MSRGRLAATLGLVGLGGLLAAVLWWVPRLGAMLFVLAVIYGLLMGVGRLLGALRDD